MNIVSDWIVLCDHGGKKKMNVNQICCTQFHLLDNSIFYAKPIISKVWGRVQLKVNCYTEVTALKPLNVIFNSLKYYNHYFYFLLYFMHMNVFPKYMSGYHLCDQYDGAQKRYSIGSLGTGVTKGYKTPCSDWELNLSPLEGQPILLITEPSL